jgi:hypothetical protein
MKLTLLLPALVLGLIISTSSETLAFGGPPGGPFSNGSYFPNDGTFSAVVRGENLTGTLQFSTSSNVSSTGVASIFYDGDSYLGNSQGANNPADSTLTVNFQADSEGQGEQIFEQNNATVNGVAGYTLQVSYFDSLSLNGFANCKTSNAFPNQKFQGTGEAELQFLDFSDDDLGYPILGKETVAIAVSGVRLADTAAFFNASNVRPPSVNHYTTVFP